MHKFLRQGTYGFRVLIVLLKQLVNFLENNLFNDWFFYYIVSQKPFLQGSVFDSFTEKRSFYFCSRNPSLKITWAKSLFNSRLVAILAQEILVFHTPPKWRPFDDTWVVQLSKWLMSHRFASQKEAEKPPDVCLPRRDHSCLYLSLGSPEEKGQRKAKAPRVLVMDSRGTV